MESMCDAGTETRERGFDSGLAAALADCLERLIPDRRL
jgi:hypothetical protein